MSGDLWLLSDLHLAGGGWDPFRADDAFAAFAGHLRARAQRAEQPPRLILLGDTLDFTMVEVGGRRLDRSATGALARLDRIAAAHPKVFAALAALAGDGVRIELVPGNHDLELLVDGVLDAVRDLVAPAGVLVRHERGVRVPGVLWAEHGQQLHALNRVRGLAGGRDRAPRPPLGTHLGEFVLAASERLGAPAQGPPPALGEFAARLRAAGPRAAAVTPAGARLALAAARHPRQAIGTLRARGGDEPYDVAAARSAATEPLLVLGHTHRPADIALGGGRRYLNTGTWSSMGAGDAPQMTFVEVRDGAAELLAWDPAGAAVRPWRGGARAR